jgi:hypothetical protein
MRQQALQQQRQRQERQGGAGILEISVRSEMCPETKEREFTPSPVRFTGTPGFSL